MTEQASGPKHARLTRQSMFATGVAVCGLALLTLGVINMWQQYRATHHAQPAAGISSKTITHTTDRPDETPIQGDTYTVAADMPRQIVINSINAKGFIQKVGVDASHAIVAPNNVHLAGWYTGSPAPGKAGVSIIDGHVQGYYQPGIFKNLNQVHVGDQIDIEYGDHTWRHFTIMSRNQYPVGQASQEQYTQLPNVTNQLTLITCGGAFNKTSQSYDQRVIVRAMLQ